MADPYDVVAAQADYRPPRIQTDRECAIVDDVLRDFSQKQTWRNTFAAHWEEIAELILPDYRNTFYYGNFNWPGQKKRDRQIDSTGELALHRFAAICDSLLTPRNMYWHGLCANYPHLKNDREVKLWYETATHQLFKYRYAPMANFSSQNQNVYTSLGAFGTASLFIDEFEGDRGERGIRYKSVPMGQLFIAENHQGIVNDVTRWFRMTASQIMQKWGEERFPEVLRPPYNQGSQNLYNILHRVWKRGDWEPQRLDAKGKLYQSCYVCIEGRSLLQEGGYHTFPYTVSRYEQAPDEMYGRSPAMMVLPALKTLNAEKAIFLKTGHRVADPVLLLADDGLVDFNMRPGAMNKGGVNADGRPMVQELVAGSIQITKEMMDEEKALINDAFLVTLFQVLTETPQMTATEVVERTNEKGILLAPTVGRQQSEYLGPLIDRELDLLSRMRLLPPMPRQLREVQGEYMVEYKSPLARAMRAQEAAGFMRTLSMAQEVVNVTQDLSILDPFDFDVAIPEIAEIQAVPPSWMASPQAIAAKKKARGEAQAKQQQIQAAPSAAALMKAHAAVAKAGGPPQQNQPAFAAPTPGAPPVAQAQPPIPMGPGEVQGP